ncbi:3'-5' exonuclease [Poseidonibacter ostreae]|jgi:DNA polymerase III subunit epsilon|uniref:3'-5' exonuclease n=1 Tax=Poseidonibacter ostreae TaxID=2654171 RepID=A0A6L4WSX6_9BACT|nr:3'-5' exonuclease [Poseidonibacter ostreae]KAB7883003.1 3'-5' exonuclease [Poseidonibacter ostreae]KAB7886337.1 3'-5' exonuclease [Poseidonibacter ostreae]KAB7889049.1 3'-5' exonuclease [Poseidonibacter ostreae]MAC82568.1 DNA polymerase III subunit epsilon [Arcobacter sp.]|tara:strand:- start:7271 stop:7903 length:633 start_codon:yes stop_codon:yes gene_type:complete
MFDKLFKNWNRKKLKDKRFDFLFDEPLPNEYVCLDCETTGLSPRKDEILSIGAVHIKDNKIIMRETFNIFVKPSKNISAESIKIHQIRPIDLENAVSPKVAIFKILDFIGSRPIVGYYIKFDIAMLSKYTKKYIGVKLPNDSIEVSSMFFKSKKKTSEYEFIDLKFDTIMKELDIPTLGKHDALNDAIMTSMMFLKLKDVTPAKTTFYTS